MTLVTLGDIAHARSGDKGSAANVGIWAKDPAWWPVLRDALTAEVVARYFAGWCSAVSRYELANLHALNFVLADALDGGGSRSLLPDAQGKTLGVALLRLQLDVPADGELAKASEGGPRS